MTQGVLAAMVSLLAPGELRGTAFGLFNVTSGLALLVGSVLAGVLLEAGSPTATFLVGAGFALLAALGLSVVRRRLSGVLDGGRIGP